MSAVAAALDGVRTIAVVGFSTMPHKAAHAIPRQLIATGYRVIPVHPTAEEILGQRAYRSLHEIPDPVDLVDVFRPAAEAPGVARQAVDVGARSLWLQLGIRSPEARALAEAAGMTYVEDACLGVEVERLGARPA